jgi:hypothetical protein
LLNTALGSEYYQVKKMFLSHQRAILDPGGFRKAGVMPTAAEKIRRLLLALAADSFELERGD